MNAKIISCLLLALGAVGLAGCDADYDSLTGHGQKPPRGEGDEDVDPASLQCTQQPDGRSYASFDGAKLEATRVNENVGVNRARVKPYAVMAGEYTRVLGAVPASLAASAASFDDPPQRWFAEASHSGVSLNAIFDISFEGCASFVKGQSDLGAAPNAASAQKFCASMMRKAWSRSASPDEIAGCVDLATNKLGQEPVAARKWTYVCASILSSSHFLTY